jgi:hypothetical protein
MSLINNQTVADKVAEMLAEPLRHPGNPDTKQPSASMVIPLFRVHGKPPPFADATRQTNQTIAEAIVYFIEKDCGNTIVATDELAVVVAELEQLRKIAAEHQNCNGKADECRTTTGGP